MNDVKIYYTIFENALPQSSFSAYLSALSFELQEKNSRYIRWQDRHSHLFGKLLLIEALKDYGLESDFWNYVKYSDYSRPYFAFGEVDFNISHSGGFVICAIGEGIRLGIDVEKNRAINIKNFRSVMNTSQWDEIENAHNPIEIFFKYWTIKESVIKADGRGLAIPLEELAVNNNIVRYDNNSWFLHELNINNNYSAAMATNQFTQFKIHRVNFYN